MRNKIYALIVCLGLVFPFRVIAQELTPPESQTWSTSKDVEAQSRASSIPIQNIERVEYKATDEKANEDTLKPSVVANKSEGFFTKIWHWLQQKANTPLQNKKVQKVVNGLQHVESRFGLSRIFGANTTSISNALKTKQWSKVWKPIAAVTIKTGSIIAGGIMAGALAGYSYVWASGTALPFITKTVLPFVRKKIPKLLKKFFTTTTTRKSVLSMVVLLASMVLGSGLVSTKYCASFTGLAAYSNTVRVLENVCKPAPDQRAVTSNTSPQTAKTNSSVSKTTSAGKVTAKKTTTAKSAAKPAATASKTTTTKSPPSPPLVEKLLATSPKAVVEKIPSPIPSIKTSAAKSVAPVKTTASSMGKMAAPAATAKTGTIKTPANSTSNSKPKTTVAKAKTAAKKAAQAVKQSVTDALSGNYFDPAVPSDDVPRGKSILSILLWSIVIAGVIGYGAWWFYKKNKVVIDDDLPNIPA